MEICGFIGPQEIILILILVLFLGVLPIIALIDVVRNEFTENNKLIWILLIVLTWIIGAVLYFFIGRKQKIT